MSSSPLRVGLLLIPGFALLSYASVVEPMRAANLIAGRELYRWIHISPGPENVASSCGAVVPCSMKVGARATLDILFVCAGGNPKEFKDKAALQWLQTMAARGLRMGAISGGPVILAQAGLMKGHHMTVHWEHAATVAESYPDVVLTKSIYIIDRNRITCAGGTAALDMMHALIAEAHGGKLARRVSDWFMHTEIRPANRSQKSSITDRYNVHDARLVEALTIIENHSGESLSRSTVARRIGVSTRQLDRLFSKYLGQSFAHEYRSVRLSRARDMLRQSALSISEIALVCGFASASHFSRHYKLAFGQTPRSVRDTDDSFVRAIEV